MTATNVERAEFIVQELWDAGEFKYRGDPSSPTIRIQRLREFSGRAWGTGLLILAFFLIFVLPILYELYQKDELLGGNPGCSAEFSEHNKEVENGYRGDRGEDVWWTKARGYSKVFVNLRGPVVAGNYDADSSTHVTKLDIGNASPSEDRVVVWMFLDARVKHGSPFPEKLYPGHEVCVTGTLSTSGDGPPYLKVDGFRKNEIIIVD